MSVVKKKQLTKIFALYEHEQWMISTEDRKTLEAFNMWYCGQMLRVSLMCGVTNMEMLERNNQIKAIKKEEGHFNRTHSIPHKSP